LIILENLTLSEAINRIKGLIKQNVVRFKPKNIKVASVLNIILILFIVIGIVFGTWIGYRMGNEPFFSFYRKTASIMIGFLISICLALIGMSFYTYVTAIYHTSLYRWTVSLEEAFEFKKPDNEKIPEILAKVLLQ
jgi:hypothetical protein